jgi:inner membrane protein
MDNLTHSLIGAALGQAGLKRRTGLAMPALILAANLPDIDAPCAIHGVESLTMRRGITHGPISLVLLPLVLAGLLWAFDRWQAKRGKRPEGRAPVHFGWLLGLCYLGTFTHPLFDWFNNYGIRLLEPFSSRWFYGDTLFIIDVWILAMLGLGLWLSLRRERRGAARPFRPVRAALAGVAAYVLGNMAISSIATDSVRMAEPYPEVAVANAVPLAFWRREVLWRNGGDYGHVDWSLFGARQPWRAGRPSNMADPRIAERDAGNRAAQAFLFWSRMPIAEIDGEAIVLRDQRFTTIPDRGPFSVRLEPVRERR